ncbi:MAG TPA: hypothetical protein VHV55_04075 [Pirellulales bacterium]|jgi:hypothetical protein|nr:hypothetical protein [Pirellulales bacterium]
MNRSLAHCIFLVALLAFAPLAWAADTSADQPDTATKPKAADKSTPADKSASADKSTAADPDADAEKKYLLRYRFKPGETLRWEVEHQAQVKTTVSGTTQTAETTTLSVKLWKVSACKPDGQATFLHSVERVDMRQKLSGRQEVRYNSRTDAEPPVGFQDVAKSVGVPLSEITLDATGTVVKRVDKQPRPPNQTTHITIPLPAEAVPLGHRWSVPYETTVTTKDGGTRAVKLRQHMTLVNVKNGVATIAVDNQVLSPVNDPTIDAQLVQSETTGKIRFDIAAGRILSTISDGDKSVVGFQGEASSLHYVTRFTEKLVPEENKQKLAGPAAPSTAPKTSKPAVSSSITNAPPPGSTPTTSAARPNTRQARPTYRRR